jgi:hypothetical protein
MQHFYSFLTRTPISVSSYIQVFTTCFGHMWPSSGIYDNSYKFLQYILTYHGTQDVLSLYVYFWNQVWFLLKYFKKELLFFPCCSSFVLLFSCLDSDACIVFRCHTLWWLVCLCAVYSWGIHYYFITLLPKTLAQYLLWQTDTQLLNVFQCLQNPLKGSSTESIPVNNFPNLSLRVCILMLSTKMAFFFEVLTKIF